MEQLELLRECTGPTKLQENLRELIQLKRIRLGSKAADGAITMKAALLALVYLFTPATASSLGNIPLDHSFASQSADKITVIHKSYDDLEGIVDDENCDIYLAEIEGGEDGSLRASTMLRNE